jgi:secreted trypsin-like serine protease
MKTCIIIFSDSGGPLSYGPLVLGLVSYGNNCDAAPEKVFTRVSKYVEFIKQNS